MKLTWGAIAIAAAIGLGAYATSREDQSVVDRYCLYGSTTEKQARDCSFDITEDEIAELDTNAAKYAREEISQCRSDAGPFCGPDAPNPLD